MNEHPASISALPVIPAPMILPGLVDSRRSIGAFAAEQGEAA
jgi:hypothetical protein